MTTQLSVIEVAELYGFNRQTVYKRINKGELSKNSDGKIDLAEAIRVFGEPASRNKSVTLETPENTAPSKEVDMLREQIDMLKEQLRLSMERERMAKEREDIAQDREAFYQNQIETMQRLLMAPKPPEEAPASAVQKDEVIKRLNREIRNALQLLSWLCTDTAEHYQSTSSYQNLLHLASIKGIREFSCT